MSKAYTIEQALKRENRRIEIVFPKGKIIELIDEANQKDGEAIQALRDWVDDYPETCQKYFGVSTWPEFCFQHFNFTRTTADTLRKKAQN